MAEQNAVATQQGTQLSVGGKDHGKEKLQRLTD